MDDISVTDFCDNFCVNPNRGDFTFGISSHGTWVPNSWAEQIGFSQNGSYQIFFTFITNANYVPLTVNNLIDTNAIANQKSPVFLGFCIPLLGNIKQHCANKKQIHMRHTAVYTCVLEVVSAQHHQQQTDDDDESG